MAMATLAGMAYSRQLLEHFENPRNVGTLDAGDPNVGTALVGSPAVGEVIRLQMRVAPATGRIDAARFKTYGSGAAIAASSLATEWLQGKTPEAAAVITHAEIARALELPPERMHCAILVADAIRVAVNDYQAKHRAAH